jgi:hypothetical protein
MGYSINEFIPPKPDTLNWNELTSRLIDYVEEMYGYGWMADEETMVYYQDNLTTLNESTSQDESCAIINEKLIPEIEADLQEGSITNEGYKFLHYYTIYIKGELEEQYEACP